jgi:hypothetical protein
MTAPGWYNEGKKLIEGETYPFQFIRIIPLSDNMNYMLMEDPFGIRHLVPYEYYSQYGLQTGTTVNCRIDKINCTGRVFLEPEHPFYKTGSTFDFKIVRFQEADKANTLPVYIVKDAFGNEILVESGSVLLNIRETGQLCCFIEGFKKGKPVLKLAIPCNEI